MKLLRYLILALAGVLAVSLVVPAPALAVEPDEVLADPVLEGRARELSKDLRCLVCRNESIDESNAELARDLRVLLRERLVAGDSDREAMDFIVDRYGEYVLLRPTTSGANWLLWAAGPLMLLTALVIGIFYVRGRARKPKAAEQRLSEEEQERLRKILED
ncbi:cytochrome c-type biogenesis protein CcmH [Leisingera aquaemixtae]|uniref:cytochrome c-type biogenesis protein n=1 Tax=Leisingera aquaemixtae TaxID=1396826 RepID=UPI001C96AFAB|nr:cytochrome c-type biogenesis protein [Leisingera aquaemixtae]MBY6065715.1 cytochrome c-type biogenesis protein CcmH [Leisingera aquaemixtae]